MILFIIKTNVQTFEGLEIWKKNVPFSKLFSYMILIYFNCLAVSRRLRSSLICWIIWSQIFQQLSLLFWVCLWWGRIFREYIPLGIYSSDFYGFYCVMSLGSGWTTLLCVNISSWSVCDHGYVTTIPPIRI